MPFPKPDSGSHPVKRFIGSGSMNDVLAQSAAFPIHEWLSESTLSGTTEGLTPIGGPVYAGATPEVAALKRERGSKLSGCGDGVVGTAPPVVVRVRNRERGSPGTDEDTPIPLSL